MTGETIDRFLGRLASRTPTPGGGAVAALQAAQAAGLVAMVARYSAGRNGQGRITSAGSAGETAHPAAPTRGQSGDVVAQRADEYRARALELADRDEAAFDAVTSARRLPKESAAQLEARSTAMAQALIAATEPPAEVIGVAAELLVLAEGLVPKATPATLADLAAAVESIRAAAAISGRNVQANLRGIEPAPAPARLRECLDRADEMVRRAEVLLAAIGGRIQPLG